MIQRAIQERLTYIATKMPVISLLGPRQSGKTTIAKAVFSSYSYVNLENVDTRTYAIEDPRGFLSTHSKGPGLIIDEIQHVPHLLSYIQTIVDESGQNGFFVLTGSQNILINRSIGQTLAGRVAIFTLLPLSVRELQVAQLLPNDLDVMLFQGSYPRIYAHQIDPRDWYQGYIQTYLERDIRDIKQVHDLSLFQKFVRLCAGRVGQILNATSLANDCGVSAPTVRSWLSLLEQNYIIFLLQPYYKNFSKRLIKSPKIYFYDTGLICSLLAIESSTVLATHYLKGGIFESFVIADIMKQRFNHGYQSQLFFWQEKMKHEIDCIVEKDGNPYAIEIKAGQTISSSFFDNLSYWAFLADTSPDRLFLVYGGKENQKRTSGIVLGWQSIDGLGLLDQ